MGFEDIVIIGLGLSRNSPTWIFLKKLKEKKMAIRDFMTEQEKKIWDELCKRKEELEEKIRENRAKRKVFMPAKEKEPLDREWAKLRNELVEVDRKLSDLRREVDKREMEKERERNFFRFLEDLGLAKTDLPPESGELFRLAIRVNRLTVVLLDLAADLYSPEDLREFIEYLRSGGIPEKLTKKMLNKVKAKLK